MIGRDPTPPEKLLIEQAAWIQLHIVLLDEQVTTGRALSLHDRRSRTAFVSTLTALMRQLRLLRGKTPGAAPPSLADHLARHAEVRTA
jgi:hypothetical protein